jgi:hypothetical protein
MSASVVAPEDADAQWFRSQCLAKRQGASSGVGSYPVQRALRRSRPRVRVA